MIGMVLVTHGHLAEEFRAALEHVVGPQKNLATVCIGPDDDIEHRRDDLRRAIESVDTGDGVVLLTDMFGSTPCNLALSLLTPHRVEALCGINLPMLVKLAKNRDHQPLPELVSLAEEAGRKYITAAHAPPGAEVKNPDAPACSTPACCAPAANGTPLSPAGEQAARGEIPGGQISGGEILPDQIPGQDPSKAPAGSPAGLAAPPSPPAPEVAPRAARG
jgi:PTS system mannose-specific IIA component